MSKQGSLFDLGSPDLTPNYGPRSHRADPESSKLAAKAHVESGNHRTNMDIVHAAVTANPGKTSSELWALPFAGREQLDKSPTGGLMELRRRLNDLLNAGAIRRGDVRQCSVANKLLATWETV